MPLIFWHFEVQILAFWLYEIDPKCFFWTCFGVRYQLEHLRCCCDVAAVSCSPTGARLGGVKLGSGLTGKLGRACLTPPNIAPLELHDTAALCMGVRQLLYFLIFEIFELD